MDQTGHNHLWRHFKCRNEPAKGRRARFYSAAAVIFFGKPCFQNGFICCESANIYRKTINKLAITSATCYNRAANRQESLRNQSINLRKAPDHGIWMEGCCATRAFAVDDRVCKAARSAARAGLHNQRRLRNHPLRRAALHVFVLHVFWPPARRAAGTPTPRQTRRANRPDLRRRCFALRSVQRLRGRISRNPWRRYGGYLPKNPRRTGKKQQKNTCQKHHKAL